MSPTSGGVKDRGGTPVACVLSNGGGWFIFASWLVSWASGVSPLKVGINYWMHAFGVRSI